MLLAFARLVQVVPGTGGCCRSENAGNSGFLLAGEPFALLG